MPVIKSAIKKLKQSRKHQARNRGVKRQVKELIDVFKKAPTAKTYAAAASALDKAAKTNIIHKNKASRLKSRLSKRLPKIEVRTISKSKTTTRKPRRATKR